MVANRSRAFFGAWLRLRTFLLEEKMDFYKVFHDLYNEVGITNNLLLELCKDEEMEALLLRQKKAIVKAWTDYHAMMEEQERKNQK